MTSQESEGTGIVISVMTARRHILLWSYVSYFVTRHNVRKIKMFHKMMCFSSSSEKVFKYGNILL